MGKMKDLLVALLKAKTTDEAWAALKPHLDAGTFEWVPYGGSEGASATIFNQQNQPNAALVEKITNAMDAVLIRACRVKGLDPEDRDRVPKNPYEAVEKFGLKGPDGKFRPQDGVYLLFDFGAGEGPCIFVVDQGEGQRPEDFHDTFMSIGRSNKARIPFVHGRFNMGGSGALVYCKDHMQLVVSRRYDGGPWGFTITRLRPADPDERVDVIEYLVLAENGQVPSVSARELRSLPLDDDFVRRVGAFTHGTVVKLFEYDWRQGANVAIVRIMNRYLIDTALPVFVWSSRYEARRGFARIPGLLAALQSKSERAADVKFSVTFGGATYTLDLKSFLLNLKEDRVYEYTVGTKRDVGIYVSVYGQMHAKISKRLVNDAGLTYIADRFVGILEIGVLPPSLVNRIVMPSRDRLRDSAEMRRLVLAIKDALSVNHTLRRANETVKRELAARENRSVEEDLSEALQQLIASNPVVRRILLSGTSELPTLIRSLEREERETEDVTPDYELHDEPTFLEFIGDKEKPRKFLRGHSFRLRFALNAKDGFFERGGKLNLHLDGRPLPYSSHNLHNGVLVVIGGLPLELEKGHKFELTVTVTCPSGRRLNETVKGVVVKPLRRVNRSRLRLPNIVTVKKEKWHEHGFDENITGKVIYGPDVFDVVINMDAVFAPKQATASRKYCLALAVSAVSLVTRFKQQPEVGEDWLENVAIAFDALGPAIAASVKLTVEEQRAVAASAAGR